MLLLKPKRFLKARLSKYDFLKTPFYEWDRKSRPETFGDYLAKKPEDELFEHRKQAMLFFIQNGNPEKKEYLKTIAKRRLSRYAKNSPLPECSLYEFLWNRNKDYLDQYAINCFCFSRLI